MKKIGFTIGKFAPFHKGHEYLIKTGIAEMDEFYVVIYETDVIDIPVEQRALWIKKCFPDIKILYAFNPPKKIGLDKKSVKVQMEYLEKIIGNIPVTHFFSSEKYGEYVARYLNIEERCVDINRDYININATNIRKDLKKYKEYLNQYVYDELIKS